MINWRYMHEDNLIYSIIIILYLKFQINMVEFYLIINIIDNVYISLKQLSIYILRSCLKLHIIILDIRSLKTHTHILKLNILNAF